MILNCQEIEQMIKGDRCLMLIKLQKLGLSSNFCLNEIISVLQTETRIQSKAKFDNLNGYFYHTEKDYFDDLEKYMLFYDCQI